MYFPNLRSTLVSEELLLTSALAEAGVGRSDGSLGPSRGRVASTPMRVPPDAQVASIPAQPPHAQSGSQTSARYAVGAFPPLCHPASRRSSGRRCCRAGFSRRAGRVCERGPTDLPSFSRAFRLSRTPEMLIRQPAAPFHTAPVHPEALKHQPAPPPTPPSSVSGLNRLPRSAA